MKVMIIFEYIPEDTKIYLLDLDGKDLEMAKKAHGVYVNVSKNDKVAVKLDDFLQNKEPLKIKTGKPFNIEGVELVIHSGFMI